MIEEKISRYIDLVVSIQKNPSNLSTITSQNSYSEFYDFLLEFALGAEGKNYQRITDTAIVKKKDLKVLIDSANFILNYILGNENYNYYENIGLSFSSSKEEITKRWKKLMLIYHPDKLNLGDNTIFEVSKIINRSYSVLSNSEKRRQYDIELAGKAGMSIGRGGKLERVERPIIKVKPTKNYKISRSLHASDNKFVNFMKGHFLLVSVIFLVFLSAITLTFIYFNNKSNTERYSSLEHQFKNDDNSQVVEPEKKKDFYEAIKDYEKFIMVHENEKPLQPAKEQNAATGSSVAEQNKDKSVAAKKNVQVKSVKKTEAVIVNKVAKEKTVTAGKNYKRVELEKNKTSGVQSVIGKKREVTTLSKKVYEVDKPAGHEGEDKKQTSIATPIIQKHSQQSDRVKNDVLMESVDNFVKKYIEYYKSRDINKFILLYSRYGRENNRRYNEIYASYKRYFDNNQIINYKITNIKAKYNPGNIVVNGKFEIEKKDRTNNLSIFSGIILWKLIKEENTIKIEEANYTGATKGK